MQKTGSNTRQSSLLILFGEEVWHFGKTVTFSGKRENFLWKGKKRVPKAAHKVAGTDFTSFQSAEENGWILASFLVCSLQLEPFLQQWLAAMTMQKEPCQAAYQAVPGRTWWPIKCRECHQSPSSDVSNTCHKDIL